MSSTDTTTSTSKPARKPAARNSLNGAAKAQPAAAQPAGQLVFEPFKGDETDLRAKGAGRHAYRITHTSAGWYAEQKGGSAWTPVGGLCGTQAEAADLVARYEGGARQLSHRAFVGLPYKEAVAKLEQ